MLTIPKDIQSRFEERVRKTGVQEAYVKSCLKWLRYYFDFCHKYKHPPENRDSLQPFLKKLQAKGQSGTQRRQAAEAIAVYYQLSNTPASLRGEPAPSPLSIQKDSIMACESKDSYPSCAADQGKETSFRTTPAVSQRASQNATATESETTGRLPTVAESSGKYEATVRGQNGSGKGFSWKEQFLRLSEEIQLRHYSVKTLKCYKVWLGKFQTFTCSKAPDSLTAGDVKEFLTFLAVKGQVAASTQNQAFNALLFFLSTRAG